MRSMASLRRGHGVVHHRRGIGPGFLLYHFNAVALRPNLQLLDSGSAEGVGGAQHHVEILLTQAIGQLSDAGGLAGAVYSDNENHARLVFPVGGSQIFMRAVRRL